MDRLDELEAFVAAVDRGSLSSAARVLGCSAASVTRALASLERRLGIELLRRTTRSLRLTEAGDRYLVVARRVLADLAQAGASASATLASPQGRLTVTAPLAFGARYVRAVVDTYLATYPDVRVQLLLLDRVVNLVDEGVDVAVRIAHLPDSALVATAVGATRRVLVASASYLARYGHPASPADLATHRCISFSAVTPGDVWNFGGSRGAGRTWHVKVAPVLSVNVADSAVGAAVDGLGITCLLSYQVADAVRTGALVAVLTAYEPAPLPVHLVYPTLAAHTAKVRAFLDLAVPRLRAEAAGVPDAPARR